jgi:hypothetical protein
MASRPICKVAKLRKSNPVKFSLLGKAVECYVCCPWLNNSQIADKFGLNYNELSEAIDEYKGNGRYVDVKFYYDKQGRNRILNSISYKYTQEDFIAALEKEMNQNIMLAAEELETIFSDPWIKTSQERTL